MKVLSVSIRSRDFFFFSFLITVSITFSWAWLYDRGRDPKRQGGTVASLLHSIWKSKSQSQLRRSYTFTLQRACIWRGVGYWSGGRWIILLLILLAYIEYLLHTRCIWLCFTKILWGKLYSHFTNEKTEAIQDDVCIIPKILMRFFFFMFKIK